MGNGVLAENEQQANKLVAKVMRITLLIYTVMYILNMAGVFVVDDTVMLVTYLCGAFFLLVPTILVYGVKSSAGYVKYVNIVCAAACVMLLCITLTYHVVAMYVYPIALACLYFSKKLNIIATVLTVISIMAGQLAGYYMQLTIDDNFETLHKAIVFGMIPRILIVIAMASIFTILSGRTAKLLSNLIDAEERRQLGTSRKLYEMVQELSGIARKSLQANKGTEEESEQLLLAATANKGAVENANGQLERLTQELMQLSEMNHKAALLTEDIGHSTEENRKRMEEMTVSMEEMAAGTEESKRIVTDLGDKSKEIISIVKMITKISDQTHILSLNASIEAARAGVHGREFAVVADEIQQLAEETKIAVENIGEIVSDVVSNTDAAVQSMERNELYVKKGTEYIQKANESSTLIASCNEELAENIHCIDRTASIIGERSNGFLQGMQEFGINTQKTCEAIQKVSENTQENTHSAERLAGVVGQIKELSEQINQNK